MATWENKKARTCRFLLTRDQLILEIRIGLWTIASPPLFLVHPLVIQSQALDLCSKPSTLKCFTHAGTWWYAGNQERSPSRYSPCTAQKKISLDRDQGRFFVSLFPSYIPLKEVPNARRTKPANNRLKLLAVIKSMDVK